MREFQGKHRFKKFLFSKVAVFILFIMIFFFAKATLDVYFKEKESAKNLAEAQGEYTDLATRQATLQGDINRLSTDEGVDEEIRTRYNVAKPGENVLVIVSTSTATTTQEKPESWWDKFRKLFK